MLANRVWRRFGVRLREAVPFWLPRQVTAVVEEGGPGVAAYIRSAGSLGDACLVGRAIAAKASNSQPGAESGTLENHLFSVIEQINLIIDTRADVSLAEIGLFLELSEAMAGRFSGEILGLPHRRLLELMDGSYETDLRFLGDHERLRFTQLYLTVLHQLIVKQLSFFGPEEPIDQFLVQFFGQLRFLGYLGVHCRLNRSDEKSRINLRKKIETQSVRRFFLSLAKLVRGATAQRQQHIAMTFNGTAAEYQKVLSKFIDLSEIYFPQSVPPRPPLVHQEFFDHLDFFWRRYTYQLYSELSHPSTSNPEAPQKISPDPQSLLATTTERLSAIGFFDPSDQAASDFLADLKSIGAVRS